MYKKLGVGGKQEIKFAYQLTSIREPKRLSISQPSKFSITRSKLEKKT